MKTFLALYRANADQMADMMKNSTPEQRRKGTEAWIKWMEDHKDSPADRGAPVGKTKRVDVNGVKDAKNDVCGYSIVQADFGRRRRQDLRQGPAVFANARRGGGNHRNPANARIGASPGRGRGRAL